MLSKAQASFIAEQRERIEMQAAQFEAQGKRLTLAEKTIEHIRLHRAQLGSSLVGFPDGYERALAEYDAAKEAM